MSRRRSGIRSSAQQDAPRAIAPQNNHTRGVGVFTVLPRGHQA
ncbi:hypothetical protein COLSTE_02274 [Collinsella stercoris DSM 13279]|uniref:Uncharacterized protein n=1 Tax=Collinsella stercoris DSM 13279 TaxID=445975 RepID=B6GDT9_9ACTN|nr:hypothetical protein COLSTE_02274 [Collinsella stercoris DSM 13279]